MITVRVAREITDYKEKIFFGLSIRKLLFASILIVLTLVLYTLGIYKLYMPKDIVQMIVIILAMILIPFGFLTPYGKNFEDYLIMVYRFKKNDGKRLYKQAGTDRFVYTKKKAKITKEEKTEENQEDIGNKKKRRIKIKRKGKTNDNRKERGKREEEKEFSDIFAFDEKAEDRKWQDTKRTLKKS